MNFSNPLISGVTKNQNQPAVPNQPTAPNQMYPGGFQPPNLQQNNPNYPPQNPQVPQYGYGYQGQPMNQPANSNYNPNQLGFGGVDQVPYGGNQPAYQYNNPGQSNFAGIPPQQQQQQQVPYQPQINQYPTQQPGFPSQSNQYPSQQLPYQGNQGYTSQVGGALPPQQPPYYPQAQYNVPQGQGYQQPYSKTLNWNPNNYLRTIYDGIDIDRNGYITSNELLTALANAQQNFNFDPRTIDFVLRKFDSNRDNKIGFDEFYNLYSYLNEEYATFIMNDANQSGTIEGYELATSLNNRGVRINPQSIQFIVTNIEQMLQRRITFDIFCRVNARFDYLCKNYTLQQRQRVGESLEQYLTNNFFTEFW